MIENQFRFHGHGSVSRLYRQGKTVRHRSMTLRYSKNPQRGHSRLTIVVGKKVFKAATKRNRIRRRLYEIIRTHWGDIAEPTDMAIIVFDGSALLMPHAELESQVLQLLKDAQILKAPSLSHN